MKEPKSVWEILAPILLILGALFALLGALGLAGISIPMRSGLQEDFFLIGAGLLAAGGLCALAAWGKRRRQTWLRENGRAVPGEVTAVRHHTTINYGAVKGRRRSPWSVECRYTWDGQTYTARTPLLWEKPAKGGQRPLVYLDPERPRRAAVDPDSVRMETELEVETL